MNDKAVDRSTLEALANLHRKPVLNEKQLRRSVAEMAAQHLPLAYIRLITEKVEVK